MCIRDRADIAKISFGSQSAVKMRKASSRKVVVSGIRNGKTKFTVITKDKRRIVCNVVRTTKFTMSPSKKRVINTNIKLKYVKSSNTKPVSYTHLDVYKRQVMVRI